MANVSCSRGKAKRCNDFFLNTFCSENKIRQFFEARMATNGRKRYFHIDENASSEKYMLY